MENGGENITNSPDRIEKIYKRVDEIDRALTSLEKNYTKLSKRSAAEDYNNDSEKIDLILEYKSTKEKIDKLTQERDKLHVELRNL